MLRSAAAVRRRGTTAARFLRLALVLIGVLLAGGPAPAATREAVVLALTGPIGPASADYVIRGLRAAEAGHAVAVVLRLDTPGGLDTAMRAIIRAMLASPVPVIAYVAPSGARAASAGTYILYASALAAMAPGTNLGAATPISLFGDAALPDTTGKPPAQPASSESAERIKILNDAVAYIRGLATLHGRNADWAEATHGRSWRSVTNQDERSFIVSLFFESEVSKVARLSPHIVWKNWKSCKSNPGAESQISCRTFPNHELHRGVDFCRLKKCCGDLRNSANDRAAVTTAANEIDFSVRKPRLCGESREGALRVTFAGPIGVEYEIIEDDRLFQY